MNINKDCKLFLRDIYSYDISSCHYTILKKIGIDLSGIDENDKEGRNIQIGIMMRDNPRITRVLRSTTEATISEYLNINNIKDEDIILRQYDGVIITKRMKDITSCNLPIELQDVFQNFIISIDRRQYIAYNGKNSKIRGVPHLYPEMKKILDKLSRINYSNKTVLFQSLQKIKDEILMSNNPKLYCIPISDEKYNVFLKKYGEITITKNAIKLIDTDEIDKLKYFDYYIRQFTQSIVLEFV